MSEGVLDLFTLATAADACATMAEALAGDPEQAKYLNATKRIADVVEAHIKKLQAEKEEADEPIRT
jgi:hypothetical protein